MNMPESLREKIQTGRELISVDPNIERFYGHYIKEREREREREREIERERVGRLVGVTYENRRNSDENLRKVSQTEIPKFF